MKIRFGERVLIGDDLTVSVKRTGRYKLSLVVGRDNLPPQDINETSAALGDDIFVIASIEERRVKLSVRAPLEMDIRRSTHNI